MLPMQRKPIIGITPNTNDPLNRYEINMAYIEAVYASGGIPIVLTIDDKSPSACDNILKACDGLILTGGSDIDTRVYGEAVSPKSGYISPLRDSFELAIAGKAFKMHKPLLGICRGMQIINIALGGTIYQDLDDFPSKIKVKHMQDAPKWYSSHDVVSIDSSIINTLHGNEFETNSFHHQLVDTVSPLLKASAFSKDGAIEGIEGLLPNIFYVGVQWHPEHLFKSNKSSFLLFRELIAASNTWNDKLRFFP